MTWPSMLRRSIVRAKKSRLGRRFGKAEDPTVALIVWEIAAVAGVVGVVAWHTGNGEVVSYGLKALGGVLVLLTAYFTARNLRQTARSSFLERMMRASELLTEPEAIKQLAGVHALGGLEKTVRKDEEKQPLRDLLEAFDQCNDASPAAKAAAHRLRDEWADQRGAGN